MHSGQLHTVVFNEEGGEDDEDRGQTVELIEALEYEDLSDHDHEEEEVVTETEKHEESAEAAGKGYQGQKVRFPFYNVFH